MSPLVKTKRQANFKDFKQFGAFKGLVETKKTLARLGQFKTRVKRAKKAQFTQELVK
jgi:hypothetical protein